MIKNGEYCWKYGSATFTISDSEEPEACIYEFTENYGGSTYLSECFRTARGFEEALPIIPIHKLLWGDE